MIIKGGARAKGMQLAIHLMRTDTNETVRVVGARSVFSKTVHGALQEMEGIAAGSRATKPLYHVSINPESDERLSLEQWHQAADRLEQALGLEGHQRVMVQHLKQGKGGDFREHMHVVWNRIDTQTLKAAHHSHNYRTHEEVARSLERDFGLKRTQGVHAELDGAEKPKEKRPSTKESMQEATTGWKKADAKAMIAAAWNAGGNGAAFQAYLEEGGYRLARGDSRDFVVIDPAGGVHSIRSGVKGLRLAEIRTRFVDLDQNKLESVSEAKASAKADYAAAQAAVAAARQAEKLKAAFPEKPARPVQPTPDRYRPLPQAHQVALVNRNTAQRVATTTPQPVPTWVREARAPVLPAVPAPVPPTPQRQQNAPSAPKATDKPAIPDSGPSPAMQDLRARQDKLWLESAAQIEGRHKAVLSKLDAHHTERLAALTVDIDRRLDDLNGLSRRAAALFDKQAYDKEIAYLVAARQRSLADERDRQEKVKEDLRREQQRELAEAKAKHDRLAALQQKVLEDAEKRKQEKGSPEATPQRRPRTWNLSRVALYTASRSPRPAAWQRPAYPGPRPTSAWP